MLHLAETHIRIHSIPAHRLAAALSRDDVRNLLAKGLAAAQVTDARSAIANIIRGECQLWGAWSYDSGAPLGLWLTMEVVTGDNRGAICVSALAGERIREWIGHLEAAMVKIARERGCEVVHFAGRRAWGRLLPRCKEVGAIGDEAIFERAAA